MSYLPDHIPAIVVNAVMDLLFPLLMTAARGNAADARQAALEMVAEYRPATREEYRLAGEIIAFSFQALEALRAASMPGIPNGAHLKLLNTANGLRRNEAAAQRKLDALQRARLAPPEKASKTTEKRPTDPPAAAQAAPQHAPSPTPASAPQPAATAPSAQTKAAQPSPQTAEKTAARLPQQTGAAMAAQLNDEKLAAMLAAATRGDYSGMFSAPAALAARGGA